MTDRKLTEAEDHPGGVVATSMMTRVSLATGEARLLLTRNRQKLGRPYNRFNREVGRRGAGDGWVGSVR